MTTAARKVAGATAGAAAVRQLLWRRPPEGNTEETFLGVATQANDFVSEKVSVVGEKIKDLQNADEGRLPNARLRAKESRPDHSDFSRSGIALVHHSWPRRRSD